MIIKSSAPAKLIITGEHSILHGYSAISTAIKQRMNVEIIKNKTNDKTIKINSKEFGNYQGIFNENYKPTNDWYSPILFIISRLSQVGYTINIKSNIDNYGFGASGALFVCVAGGIIKSLTQYSKSKYELANEIFLLYKDFLKEKKQQKYHSGIDIITSIFGGVVYFEPKINKIILLPNDLFKQFNGITAIYTGHKTDTDDAYKVADKTTNKDEIYEKMGTLTQKIYEQIVYGDKEKFEKYIVKNQEYLEKLGLCDDETNEILKMCKQHNHSAKISGSGLGDCVLVFDKVETDKYKTTDIKIDNNGLIVDIVR